MPGMSRGEDHNERQFQECRECPIMVGIPAGTFLMGSPPNENGRFDSEGPQHIVTIKAFALGKYDVTTQEFATFLKETGYEPEPCNPTLGLKWNSSAPYSAAPLKWPAVCLNWRAAQSYIAWLNRKIHGDHLSAGTNGPYRLPTEAEWEYASRAGTTAARWWGDSIGVGNANCNGCGSPWDNRLLADVDSFASNPFGLYGNAG
jgi:formylglycine-generating enzyme required for sulfatase activity